MHTALLCMHNAYVYRLKANGWDVTQIINTHWHPDHTDGNLEVKAKHGAIVVGPVGEEEQIPGE